MQCTRLNKPRPRRRVEPSSKGASMKPFLVDRPAIIAVRDAPAALEPWVADGEAAGSGIVRRLVDEWTSGVNRFDGPGEALFGASVGGRLVGVCGLNVDPYAAHARTGRVRHLYVLSPFRGRGVGRALVTAVIEAARGRFDSLRLRTGNPVAARLYESLGFHASNGLPHATHIMAFAVYPMSTRVHPHG
jgi:GNAT superfamily N-acetyltransferase